MAKLSDSIIIIDLEATCWEGEPPKGVVSEIIEIGICYAHVGCYHQQGKYHILLGDNAVAISAWLYVFYSTLLNVDIK